MPKLGGCNLGANASHLSSHVEKLKQQNKFLIRVYVREGEKERAGTGFISWGYHKKLPPRWLTTEIHFLPVLETRRPKWRCGQGSAPSKGSGGESVPCLSSSSWWPPAFPGFLGLWLRHSNPCFHLHIIFSVCLFSSFVSVKYLSASLLKERMWLHLGPTWKIQDKFLLSSSST